MKLAEALSLIQRTPANATQYSVLLACGFSPLHLQTFLAAHLQARTGRKVAMNLGLYGSLADTVEQLASFQGDSVALFIEWADLDVRLGYRSLGGWGDMLDCVEASLARFAAALQRKPPSLRLVVSLPTLALPPGFHTVGWQASVAELAIESALNSFALKIAELPAILIVNRQRLAVSSTQAERYDFRSDLNAGFPYSIRHVDVVAGAVAELLTIRSPKKGLISDLDETMWKGIVGEVGPDGVAWDLARHAQVHGLYQQMLQSLAGQGVLLGIASKNNPETAERAIQRPDFAIKRDKIFPTEIHWEAKSGSVARILKTWNIGADSVVFIDDSPMELEEVRAAHPGIECILFPKNDYSAAFAFLQRLRDLFGKEKLSEEDTFRVESIRHGQQFLEAASNGDLAERFLSSADGRMTFEWPPSNADSRILELVNKTNQFNLNGRRFSESEWQQLAGATDTFVTAVSYQDKFGPLGKIAVLTGKMDGATLSITAWVMSCRAFSRRIEFQTLKRVFEKTGAETISFEFLGTPKNGPMRDFLTGLIGNEKLLTKQEFAVRCPALYHQVTFNSED